MLDRWWPLLICLAVAVLGVALAFVLVGRRDYSAGLLPPRLGRPAGRIGTIVGLSWRTQRTAIISWALAILLSALLIGLLSDSVVDFIDDDPDLAQLFPTGPEGALASALALYVVFLAVLAAAYVAMAVGAARLEETSGRAAPLLALPVGRVRWLGAQAGLACVVAVVTMLVSGLVMGLAAARSLDDSSQVGDLLGACAVTLPAILLVLGLAVAVLGWLPGAFGLLWAYVAYIAVMGMFGAILPDGLDALSPFTYLPALPSEPMDWPPVFIVSAIALALVGLGLAGFRRRDLAA